MEVKFWNKWLFSEPDQSGWVFKFLVDTYESGFKYITNYVMADTLSTASIGKNIKQGHLFIAFKSLGDAKGFQFYGLDKKGHVSAILGDSIRLDQVKSLYSVSPLPGRFKLIHNGKVIKVSQEKVYEFSANKSLEKGNYRIEVELNLQGKFIPWIYTNPMVLF